MFVINIYSKGEYPSCAFSNFAPHEFVFDGVYCSCMEAFLQSLKESDVKKQEELCKIDARTAKEMGQTKYWQADGLWWQGVRYCRKSKEYTRLIECAYDALFENPDFKDALVASKNKILLHTIGRNFKMKTVLTTCEFCGNLRRLRRKLKY